MFHYLLDKNFPRVKAMKCESPMSLIMFVFNAQSFGILYEKILYITSYEIPLFIENT